MRQLIIHHGAVVLLLSLGSGCAYLGDLDEANPQESGAPDATQEGRADAGGQAPEDRQPVDDDSLDAGEGGAPDLRAPLDVDDGRGDLPPLMPRDAQEPPSDVLHQGRDATSPPDDVDFPPDAEQPEVTNNGRDLQG